VIAVMDLDEACNEMKNAAAAGDVKALEALGWKLLGECSTIAASLQTLRAACHGVPETAWPAHQLPDALRAA
jgi:hypothetical protein